MDMRIWVKGSNRLKPVLQKEGDGVFIIPNTTKAMHLNPPKCIENCSIALETILKHDKEADEQIEGFTGRQLTET